MSCCGQHRHDTTPDHQADVTATPGHHEAQNDQASQGCCGAGGQAARAQHPTEPATQPS